MASSNDNQGLQIAVIIFALLTIVMSGATFYVFKLSEDAELRAAKANEDAQRNEAAAKTAINEIDMLRKWCGMPDQITEKDPSKLEATFKKDMELYGGNSVGEDLRNYSKLLAANFTTMKTANDERTTERALLETMKKNMTTVEANRIVQLDNHKQQAATAADQLTQRGVVYEEKEKELLKERADLNSSINTLRDEVATKTAQIQKDAQASLVTITSLRSQNEGMGDQIRKLSKEEIEVPDGAIRWVSAATRSVWIDVGRGDNVRKQTSFGVWGIDENGVARGPKKASIEITQILGEHLAEARILEDDFSNPILIGDKIYTPLWDPGEKARFAICGQIDINGDNVSDLPMVRDLITTSGGTLDAELLPDGKMQGSMSIATRFLILGAPFTGNNVDAAKAAENSMGKMQKDAKDLGIQVIQAAEFLDRMGWKDSSNVVNFGKDADPKDFNYNPATKGQRPTANREEAEQFRRRGPPPAASLRSAYPADKSKK